MVHGHLDSSPTTTDATSESATLGKAVTRAAELFGLSQQSLAVILGILGVGVFASILRSRRREGEFAPPSPASPGESLLGSDHHSP